VNIILYENQGNQHTAFAAALSSLGLGYTSADTSNFQSLIAAADPANTLVLFSSPTTFPDPTPLSNFIAAGGSAIMSLWYLEGYPDVVDAFDATFQSSFMEPQPIYGWSESPILDGLDQIVFDSDNWGRNAWALSATADGEAIAGFAADPSSSGAIIVGNEGRTILNGFLFDDLVDGQAVEMAKNQINFILNGTNQAPVVIPTGNDTGLVIEDDPASVVVGGMLTASDPDGDQVTWHAPADELTGLYGSFTLGADGSWSFTFDNAAAQSLREGEELYQGFLAFVTDANGATSDQTATVMVTIRGANDAPDAANDVATVSEDKSGSGNLVTGAPTTNAGRDTDPDAMDALRITAIATASGTQAVAASGPTAIAGTWGTLLVSADGSYSYSADGDELDVLAAGTQKTDSFTYTVSDGYGGTDTATLTVTAVATNDTATRIGTAKADTLVGDRLAAGIEDSIEGGGGNDKIDGLAGADLLKGGSGDDQMWGGTGRDTLHGEAGNDKLYGGDGNDTLVGGLGNDQMTGGTGADVFVFLNGKSRGEVDAILDFTTDDRIQLQGGATIVGVSTSSVGGTAALDTVLHLSSGGTVQLFDFVDWNASLVVA
jgi:VCBS repeat-containing protein